MTKTTTTATADFALVSAAYAAAATFAQKVEDLRDAAKKDNVSFDLKGIKAWLAPATAEYYKVQLVAKERGEGTTWGKDTASQTAKKQNDRLAAAVLGEVSKSQEEVEIPAELLAAAAKLVKLAKEYEGARSLASKALAAAWTA